MMPTSIHSGKIELSNIQNGYLVNETKDRVDNLEKCIDVIREIEERQSDINESISEKFEDINNNLSYDEDLFYTLVNLYQTKEKISSMKMDSLEKKCNKYKRNTFIAFITSGIIDIILCVMLIMQIYT